MLENEGNKLNRVDELKNKLFSKNYNTNIEHRDGFARKAGGEVSDDWNVNAIPKEHHEKTLFIKTSVFRNFFIISIILLIITLSYGIFVYFRGSNTVSNDNIDIKVTGNNFTAGGEDLSLIVAITNKNATSLDLVDLITEYPKSGGASADNPAGTEHFRQSLGSIPAGSVRNENLKLVLYGEQNTVVPVKISIEYRVKGSNAIFVKDVTHNVTINSTPLNISLEAPDTITPNQDIVLNLKTTLNSTKPLLNMALKVDYPLGFQFTSANPAPSSGDNLWYLGDLAPSSVHSIAITGKMLDVFNGEQKIFRVTSGSQSTSDKSLLDVVFNTVSHLVTIQKPFIATQLYVNGLYKNEYSVNTNGQVHGQIHWVNNLDTKVTDFVIKAKVSGNVLDRRSINVDQGFYNSVDDTITWDRNSLSDFAEVNPGDNGAVDFTLSSLPIYSSSSGLVVDPSIKVEISVTGKQSQAGYATQTLTNFESKTVKVITDVGLNTKVTYSTGPFKNSGAVPPKVEKETTYTVTWTISNSANNLSNAVVTSGLPTWVRFVGTISPDGEDLTFNPATRALVWNAGKVSRGAGMTDSPRSISFQVGFTPSLSQVGSTPVLVNESSLTAHDDFANVDVKVNKGSLRTTLDSAPAFPLGSGMVSQ